MSLISRLPNELLLEVFSDYIALPNALDEFHGDTRFVLAGVCREWRGLILQAPLLWQAITINTHSVMPYPLYDPTIHPARVFLRPSIALDRAGGLPVDLTIDLPDDAHSPTFNLNHCVLLAKILRRVAPRIASLTISGDDWQMNLQVLIGLLNQPMPLLHTYTHTVFQGIDVCEQTHFESFTEHSNTLISILQYPYADAHLANVNEWGRTMYPKLESVEISGAPYKLHLLPTTGLKRLGLCNQPSAACPPHALIQDVLSFAANTLEELWLPGVLHHSPEGPTPAAPTPITLPNLDRLTLGYQSPHEVANFLPYIRTPSLMRLDISDDSMNFQTAAQAPKHSTDAMLDALIRYLPLNQLSRLELGHVIFNDEIPIPDIDAFLLEDKVAPKDVPFTLRFLSALSSLQHLEIWVTDQHLLSFLNYPKKPSFGTDGRALHGGASQLPSLHHAHLPALHTLHLFGYLQEASIQQFLKYRVHATVREKPLNVLISNPLLRTLDEQKFALFQFLTAELARGTRIVEVDNDVVMG